MSYDFSAILKSFVPGDGGKVLKKKDIGRERERERESERERVSERARRAFERREWKRKSNEANLFAGILVKKW
jgi:hypothetical protein